MAINKVQVKRTSVSGRTANVTSSGNSQYIDAGEFALNMADGILYTSNGSALITVGANQVNQSVTGTLAVNAISSNGSLGTAGQVLTSNGTTVYWSTVAGGGGGSGTVTSVSTGNGMTGGTITTTGTVSILANTGIVANSTGAFVNASYIGTLTANNTSFVGTVSAANVVSNAQLSSNLANYQTTAGLSANVATLTSNDSTFSYGKTEGALNVNSALTANNSTNLGGTAASGYQTTAGLSANVATLTSNNSTFVFGKSENTLNVNSSLTANNSTNLGGTVAASYVQNTDSRTLSGNLIISGTSFTPSSNAILLGNSTQRWVLSANTGSFSGAVSGITTLAAGNTTITGFANVSANMQVTGTLSANNPIINNLRIGYNTTATAAGTTTLTSTSNYLQFFTGTTTQILSLPAPQTMTLGMGFFVVNNSTGNIEVRASNAAVVATILPGMAMLFVSIDLTAGNGAAGWSAEIVGFSTATGTGSVVLSASPTLTGTVTATGGANSIVLTNATSNWIYYGTAGVGAPTETTRSAGTKLVLYPAISATSVDYAIGIDGATLWYSVPDTTSAMKWYANTTNFMFANTSLLNHSGVVNAASHTVGTAFTANSTVVNAVAYYSGTLLVANSTVSNATHLGGVAAASYVNTSGNYTLSGKLNFTAGANSIALTNSTSNWIYWDAVGTGAPAFTTRSVGTKIVLYPTLGASQVDYGFGVNAGTLWSSIPGNDSGQFFKWYGGTTEVASLSGTGNLTLVGSANANTLYAATSANIASIVQANSLGVHVGANVVANVTTLKVGNTTLTTTNAIFGGTIATNGSIGTAGQVLTSGAGTNAYWSTISAGGGSTYMKGGSATVGSLATEGQNIFRVNANTINYNTTFVSGENGQATGPIAVASGITLTISSGARVAIV